MSDETQSTALTINTDEVMTEIQKEVQDEFVTSDRDVYKEGLRSLVIQEQQLQKQIASIQKDINQLKEAKNALDTAFKNGELHSVEDARGVTRRVARNSIDREFD